MRRIAAALFVMILLANAVPDHALGLDTRSVTLSRTPVNKLFRGVINIFTCLIEIPASIADVTRNKGIVQGATLGLADGIATAFLRLGTGLFDTVTFVIPPYDNPILKPEYAIDSARDKFNFPEGE